MNITEKYNSPIPFVSEFPELKELKQGPSDPPFPSTGGNSQTAAADSPAAMLPAGSSASSTKIDESSCEIPESESQQETERTDNSSILIIANRASTYGQSCK